MLTLYTLLKLENWNAGRSHDSDLKLWHGNAAHCTIMQPMCENAVSKIKPKAI